MMLLFRSPYVRSLPLALGWLSYAAGVAWLLSRHSFAWRGDSLLGQESIAMAHLLALPIVLSVIALQGVEDRRVIYPLTTTRQRLRHLAAALPVLALPGVVVLLIGHAAVAVGSVTNEIDYGNWSGWLLLTQAISLILATALSYLVGLRIESWAAAAAVAPVLWIALLIADKADWLDTKLAEFSPMGTLIGYTPIESVFGFRALWMSAVLLGLLVAALWVDGRRSGALIGITAGIFASGMVINTHQDGYRVAQSERTVCGGENPELCAPATLAPQMRELRPVVSAALDQLRGLGITPINRYVAWTAQTDIANEPYIIITDPLRPGSLVRPSEILGDVVAPRSCTIWKGDEPPPDAWYSAESVVTDWARVQLGYTPTEQYQRFLKQSPNEADQRALITRAARSLQECTLDGLPTEEELGGLS